MERRTFLSHSLAAAAAAAGSSTLLGQQPAPPLSNSPYLRCRFGVNYTPSRNWWYCWNDWQLDSIQRDLDAIATLGADHVRILLIWPFFQPNAAWVSPAHLERLGELLDAMRSRQLDAVVTAFTGQLSGEYFLPPFQDAYKAGSGSFFQDATMLSAQQTYLRALGTVLRQSPNVLALDLGNEINTCWQSSTTNGDAWMRLAIGLAEGAVRGSLVVNGVDHEPWFRPDTFSAGALARLPFPVIHCYPWWTGALHYGGLFDAPSVGLIAGMAALVRAYAGDASKPVWCEEFNTCVPDITEQQSARWLELAVAAAMENGVAWFTYWDSHDLNPKFQFNPVEYQLGLLTNDGQVKEQGRKFQALAKIYRGKVVETRPHVPPPPANPSMETTWRWLMDWLAYKRT